MEWYGCIGEDEYYPYFVCLRGHFIKTRIVTSIRRYCGGHCVDVLIPRGLIFARVQTEPIAITIQE